MMPVDSGQGVVMLWILISATLSRSSVLIPLHTQHIRQWKRHAQSMDKHCTGQINHLPINATLPADFLMFTLLRSNLREIAKSAAFINLLA